MPLLQINRRREKRQRIRRTINADALVRQEHSVLAGKINNISDNGAYLATNGQFSIGDLFDLTIYFQHSSNKLSMTVPCKVARIDGNGIGVTSPHIDSILLLRLEVLYDVSKHNSKQLIEEFCKAI